MIAVLVVSFVALLLINVPVAFSLAIASLLALLWGDLPLTLVLQRMTNAADSFILLAIPFFILAGKLMARSGIAQAIVDFAASLVGFVRGGLGHVNILTSMFFGGITGAAVADTSAIGSVLIPPMLKRGYGRGMTTAVTAASSTIGVIIPPSIPMIIFGVVSGTSVGRLFLAGVVPGILIGLALMLVTYVAALRSGMQSDHMLRWREVVRHFRRSILALLMPVLIVGGILLGVFTPTEAAVVAVLYAFGVGVFVLRTIHLRDLPAILLESAATTAVVMLMIAAASLYGLIIAREQIPQQAVELITTITGNPVLIIAMMVVLYLLAGMVLDLGANIIILVPVLAPVAAAVGLDPVHFGIITVMALAIGLVTPPVGVCLFVACGISGTPLLQGSKAVLPYLAAILAVLALVIAVPGLALWLPGVVD